MVTNNLPKTEQPPLTHMVSVQLNTRPNAVQEVTPRERGEAAAGFRTKTLPEHTCNKNPTPMTRCQVQKDARPNCGARE